MKDEIPEDKLGEENKKRKIEKIKGIDKMVNRENLICKKDNTYIYIYIYIYAVSTKSFVKNILIAKVLSLMLMKIKVVY